MELIQQDAVNISEPTKMKILGLSRFSKPIYRPVIINVNGTQKICDQFKEQDDNFEFIIEQYHKLYSVTTEHYYGTNEDLSQTYVFTRIVINAKDSFNIDDTQYIPREELVITTRYKIHLINDQYFFCYINGTAARDIETPVFTVLYNNYDISINWALFKPNNKYDTNVNWETLKLSNKDQKFDTENKSGATRVVATEYGFRNMVTGDILDKVFTRPFEALSYCKDKLGMGRWEVIKRSVYYDEWTKY